MGPASLYLGNRIMHDYSCHKLWLSQKSYCVKLLCTWNLSHCATALMPMVLKPYFLDPAPVRRHPIPPHILDPSDLHSNTSFNTLSYIPLHCRLL